VALELVTSRYPKFWGIFLSVFNDSITELNIYMSWFKRIPHRYPPATPAPTPYRSSPATDRALEQAKENGPGSHKNVKKTRPINKG
jgi:hypothetical protein